MARFASFVVLAISLVSSVVAFPAHQPLAGLSIEKRDAIIRNLQPVKPPGPPPPLKYNGTKLVNDAAHPWQPRRPGDQRGPCPGLNTLASHGYIPRNGITTPYQLMNAIQEGFNAETILARRFVYGGMVTDGNLVTDLVSIGYKSPLTGPDPPGLAPISGLATHGPFQGDASLTRNDNFFGDDISFNETLWEQFVDIANQYGGGKLNYTSVGEFRWRRIQDSIANNPEFDLRYNRYFAAYSEITLIVNLWKDGRYPDGQVDPEVALGFLRDFRMPDDFHRAPMPMAIEGLDFIFNMHPIPPGSNVHGVNTYTEDPNAPNMTNDPGSCNLYKWYVEQVIVPLYPEPTGVLKRNLNINLQIYFDTYPGCEQLFPYGKPEDDDYC